MKNLAAVALVALALAGCGAQPNAAPRLASQQGLMASKAKADHQQLYGIIVTAEVRKVRLTTFPDSRVITATIDVIEAVNTFDNSRVKGRIQITVGEALNAGLDLADVKAGSTIQAFVNYPLIDRATNTIVAQSRPYSSHAVKVLK